jgi:hypothetical protein
VVRSVKTAQKSCEVDLTAVQLRRSGQENVEYPDGAETLDEAARRAREQRVEGTVNEEIYTVVPNRVQT